MSEPLTVGRAVKLGDTPSKSRIKRLTAQGCTNVPDLTSESTRLVFLERAVISAALQYREAEKKYDRQPVSITHSFEFKTTRAGAELLLALACACDALAEVRSKKRNGRADFSTLP